MEDLESSKDGSDVQSEGELQTPIEQARLHAIEQENMIVVCTAENNLEIKPDRPVNFLELDYRQDLKVELFTERDI